MNITVVHDGYLPRAAAPTPAARRQRRHRARRNKATSILVDLRAESRQPARQNGRAARLFP